MAGRPQGAPSNFEFLPFTMEPESDFPDDSWFHSSLHPMLRDGLKLMYQVYGINVQSLYTDYVAARVSRQAVRWIRSEAYEAILTAIILAAQDKLGEQRFEEQTICADNPLLAIDLGAQAAQEASISLNPVYSPHTQPRPPAPPAPPHCQEISTQGGGIRREEKLRDTPDFGKLLHGRQEVMNRYRHTSDHAEQHAGSLLLNGKPQPSSSPAAVTQNLAQSTPGRHAAAAAAHAHNQDLDDASTVSQQEPDNAKALKAYNDTERAKSNQRRDVLDKAIRFKPGQTYLHDFIEVTTSLLSNKHFLDQKDKALLVVQMLDKTVTEKLKGDHRIVNPANPEQIFGLLRVTYPVNQLQLSTDIYRMTQGLGQSAVTFLDALKTKYIMHGVGLPTRHSEYLSLHLKFNPKFAAYMREYDRQVAFDRQQRNLPPGDYDFLWEDFNRLATQYDQQRQLLQTSREATALSGNPLTNDRTRSASASRLSALQAEDRHHSRSDGDRSSPKFARKERSSSGSFGTQRPPHSARKVTDRHGSTGTGVQRSDKPRPEKSRLAGNPDGRAPFVKGSLILGPSRNPKKEARLAAAQEQATESDSEQEPQCEHDKVEEFESTGYESSAEDSDDSAN